MRLCFIMYLAHPAIQILFLFNLKQTIYITELIGVSRLSQIEAEVVTEALYETGPEADTEVEAGTEAESMAEAEA